jgi:hypothetical protein
MASKKRRHFGFKAFSYTPKPKSAMEDIDEKNNIR